jgi:Lrp/AsnC family transcriptional regulator for asnA, asnC and gidA
LKSNGSSIPDGKPVTDKTPLMGGRQIRFANVLEEEVSNAVNSDFEGMNRDIVSLLQEDGRASFSSIAQKLGVSEATVRSRVRRMRESNLISFVTVVNPLALGYTAWAMLGIRVGQGVSADKVAEYFRDCPEVVYAMRVASRFDLLAEVVCSNPEELRDFLDAHCYGSEMVSSVEPMVGLGLYKSLFKWEKPLAATGKGESKNSGGRVKPQV